MEPKHHMLLTQGPRYATTKSRLLILTKAHSGILSQQSKICRYDWACACECGSQAFKNLIALGISFWKILPDKTS